MGSIMKLHEARAILNEESCELNEAIKPTGRQDSYNPTHTAKIKHSDGFVTRITLQAKDDNDAMTKVHRSAQSVPGSEYVKGTLKKINEEVELDEASKSVYVSLARRVSDPDYTGSSNIDQVVDRAAKTHGDKFANDLASGARDMHFPRQNHVYGHDKLADRTPTRKTAAGKVHSQDVKSLKNKLRAEGFDIVDIEAVLEEGVVDAVKKGIKSVKRGLQGWGGKGLAITGDENAPKDVVRRTKSYGDETIKRLHRPGEGDSHSPAGLQKKVIDREMKKRGLTVEDVKSVVKQINEIRGKEGYGFMDHDAHQKLSVSAGHSAPSAPVKRSGMAVGGKFTEHAKGTSHSDAHMSGHLAAVRKPGVAVTVHHPQGSATYTHNASSGKTEIMHHGL